MRAIECFIAFAVFCGVCETLSETELTVGECGIFEVTDTPEQGEKLWPWAVDLINRMTEKQFCSGSLISNKHVLSAASCFQPKGISTPTHPENVLVQLGKHYSNETNQVDAWQTSVWEIILHPDWVVNETEYDANIAIVVLIGPLEFMKEIQPICVPKPNDIVVLSNGFMMGQNFTSHDDSSKLEESQQESHDLEITTTADSQPNVDEDIDYYSTVDSTNVLDSTEPVDWENPTAIDESMTTTSSIDDEFNEYSTNIPDSEDGESFNTANILVVAETVDDVTETRVPKGSFELETPTDQNDSEELILTIPKKVVADSFTTSPKPIESTTAEVLYKSTQGTRILKTKKVYHQHAQSDFDISNLSEEQNELHLPSDWEWKEASSNEKARRYSERTDDSSNELKFQNDEPDENHEQVEDTTISITEVNSSQEIVSKVPDLSNQTSILDTKDEENSNNITRDGDSFNPALPKDVRATYLNKSNCYTSLPLSDDILSPVTFCVGFSRPEDSSCSHVTGGGLYYRENSNPWKITGIFSDPQIQNTSACDNFEVHQPSFANYTIVAMFSDWISETMNNTETVDYKELEFKCTIRNNDYSYCKPATKSTFGRNMKFQPTTYEYYDEQDFDDVKDLKITFGASPRMLGGIGEAFISVRILIVTFGSLQYLDRSNFAHMKYLRKLLLNDNKIEFLPDEVFNDLPHLEELNLSANRISKVPAELLIELRHLETFFMSFNSLTHINKTFFKKNIKLQAIDLSDNYLTSIKVDFTKQKKLVYLNLERNFCVNKTFIQGSESSKTLEGIQDWINSGCNK